MPPTSRAHAHPWRGRYWGSRPELASKMRITVGSAESNDRFFALLDKFLSESKA